MAAWSELETTAPELAAAVRGSFEGHLHHVVGTLKADGSPRLTGTEARDLRRDPGIAAAFVCDIDAMTLTKVAGDPAITAEQLMRSRYAAHTKLDAAYLSRSWQTATRPNEIILDDDITWRGLVVHRTERGKALDADGVVEFTATYERAGKVVNMREISRFARESGRWVYVDGYRPV